MNRSKCQYSWDNKMLYLSVLLLTEYFICECFIYSALSCKHYHLMEVIGGIDKVKTKYASNQFYRSIHNNWKNWIFQCHS